MNSISSQIYHGGGKWKCGYNAAGGGGGSGTDEKVKVTAADTTSNYLFDKILGATDNFITILNPGADEDLVINSLGHVRVSAADALGDYLAGKVVTVDAANHTILNPGANEDLQIDETKLFATATDTVSGYLANKIVPSSSIDFNLFNPGGNEFLEPTVKDYLETKVTTNDTTPGFLDDKIVVDATMVKTVLNPGGDEDLELSCDSGGTNEEHTMIFAETGALGVDTLIEAPQNGSWAGNGQGFFTGSQALRLREIMVCVNRFLTFAVGSFTIQLRRITPNQAAFLTGAGDGTLIGSVVVNLPNTAGAFNYYGGDSNVSLNVVIPANQVVFCVVSAFNANSVTGVTVNAQLEDV